MSQTILTAGDLTNGLVSAAGNDGTLVLQSGLAGAKVNAISLAADGTPTFLKSAPEYILIASQVASASATIDFTGLSGANDDYKLVFRNLVPATDDSAIYFRVSQAATFKSDATYSYSCSVTNIAGGAPLTSISSGSAVQAQLTGGINSIASEGGANGEFEIRSCSGASANKTFTYVVDAHRATVGQQHLIGGGAYRGAVSAVDGLRIFMSTGNIASGTAYLYKRNKS
jgi:hypothetical protein